MFRSDMVVGIKCIKNFQAAWKERFYDPDRGTFMRQVGTKRFRLLAGELLTEVNDIGQQIAEALHMELEYDNVMMTTQKGRAGQILGAMFSGRGTSLGVRMTKQIKKIGCANIKTLIEGDKLLINDFDIIQEMSTFSRRGNSWRAEEGCTDDLMMCLVVFGWLSNQAYFKELTNINARQMMYEEQQNLIEQDMAPFGFVDDGINEQEQETVDEYGTRWYPATRKGM